MAKKVMVVSTTDQEYILHKHEMRETDPWMTYSASREAIRSAIQQPIGTAGTVKIVYSAGDRDNLARNYPAYVSRYRGEVRIGCQRFTGRNFQKLKKWALGLS